MDPDGRGSRNRGKRSCNQDILCEKVYFQLKMCECFRESIEKHTDFGNFGSYYNGCHYYDMKRYGEREEHSVIYFPPPPQKDTVFEGSLQHKKNQKSACGFRSSDDEGLDANLIKQQQRGTEGWEQTQKELRGDVKRT